MVSPQPAEPVGVDHEDLRPTRTRTSTAWALAGAAAFLGLLMLIFIFQNSESVPLKFLWMDGHVPLGAAVLLAAVLGALMVVLLGAGRVLQLRLAARRHRKANETSTPPPVA